MKRYNLFALLTAGICCLALIPAFPAKAGSSIRLGHFENNSQFRSAAKNGILTAVPDVAADTGGSLPSAYDLREHGLVTKVQDQGNYGMCWSFSSLASLESTLITRDPLVNLSEWHLAYYTYSDQFGLSSDAETIEDVFETGGNAFILSTLLTKWAGPVNEETYPSGNFELLDPDASLEEVMEGDTCHITDVKMMNYNCFSEVFEEQIDSIRQAVYDGHAVSISYQNRDICYNDDKTTFYSDIYDDGVSSYHAVTIVGWDDNYPADAFVSDPGRDGAWLIKNSWGPDYGEHGYFWMSYANASIVECFYLEAEPVQVHDKQYRYDDYGYWTSFSVEEEDESDYMANVFTAEEDTWLTSVMFCTAMPEEDYTAEVYTGLKRKNVPNSGTLRTSASGHLSAYGYHTVDLEQPVYLKEGETFSIVVHLSGDYGQHIPCESYLRYTTTYSDGSTEVDESMVKEEMIDQNFHAGESFYSTDGKNWNDFYDEEVYRESYEIIVDVDETATTDIYARMGNACIRGLTQSPGKVVFSDYAEAVPSGTQITLSCPGADAIYYSVNGGEEQLFSDPITIMEETELSAYAVSGNTVCPVYTQHYGIQAAQLSSLLETQNNSYVTFEPLGGNVYTTVITDNAPAFLPITTGTITCEQAEFTSGHITQPDASLPAISFRVSEGGMQDSLYIIYRTEDYIGDTNLNGILETADAADILVQIANEGAGNTESVPDAAWVVRADYHQDGIIDTSDAASILTAIAEQGAGVSF